MSFDDDLDSQLTAEPNWADAEVVVNNRFVTLRFTQMDALEWADITDQCPPRLGSPIDRNFGFNFRAAVSLAAPLSGKKVDGDEVEELTEEQWRKLLKGLSSIGLKSIGDVIFNLNEWLPAQEIAEAKKASAVGSDSSSNSPAPSGSPAAS